MLGGTERKESEGEHKRTANDVIAMAFSPSAPHNYSRMVDLATDLAIIYLPPMELSALVQCAFEFMCHERTLNLCIVQLSYRTQSYTTISCRSIVQSLPRDHVVGVSEGWVLVLEIDEVARGQALNDLVVH